MPQFSIGDLANSFQTRRQFFGLKTDMNRLSLEMTTGKKADLGAALSGDYGAYAMLERSLSTLSAFETANSETAGFLQAAQTALGTVQTIGQALAPKLLASANGENVADIDITVQEAAQNFAASISILNTQFAGRSLFSGAEVDAPALTDANTMLAALSTAATGETTATGVIAAVDNWFDTAGGGFETSGYGGSTQGVGSLPVAENENVKYEIRADDPALRQTLKGLAIAALVSNGMLNGNPTEQRALITEAGNKLLSVDGKLTNIRARLGALEEHVESAKARNSTETAAYENARTKLLAADPYDTATNLQEIYTRIETLYATSARIAKLSFTDYMR